MCPSANWATYPVFSGKEGNLPICNLGSKRKFNSCRIKKEEAILLDQPQRRQQYMVKTEFRSRGKETLGWLGQPCSVPSHKISIRRIPKKLKMDMTAAERRIGSRQLRCRAESMPNNIQIFEHITSVQLPGNFYPESELSQCLQQEKFSKNILQSSYMSVS